MCHVLVGGARNAALLRGYRRLGAVSLFEDDRTVPLTYAGNMPHYLLTFDIIAAERHWFESNHALFNFMFETVHADIQLFSPSKIHFTPALRAVA